MVESIRRREGQTVVESREGEVALKVERRESRRSLVRRRRGRRGRY